MRRSLLRWVAVTAVGFGCGSAAVNAPVAETTGVGPDAGVTDGAAAAPGFADADRDVAKDAGCFDPSITMTPMTGAPLGPAFAPLYVAYDLGSVPGVPSGVGQSLGGCAIRPDDPDHLYVVGESEHANGALYRVKLRRDACKHIVGFDGAAEKIASIPFADANLLSTPFGWLYSIFPSAKIGQLKTGGAIVESDLVAHGVNGPYVYNPSDAFPGESPGGLSIVPAELAEAGALVALAYPSGDFLRLGVSTTGGDVSVVKVTKSVKLQNGPGAFAYVPKGSPGFPEPSIIVTEWFQGASWKSIYNDPPDGTPQAVAVYDVDETGAPKPLTRRAFFTQFPRPWGAFFEPLTGDFLFATWRGSQGASPDRIVQVRGFAVPSVTPAPR